MRRRRWLWAGTCLLLSLALLGCKSEEQGNTTDGGGSGDGSSTGPGQGVICVGDPDTAIVCKEEGDFWDCEQMPNGEVKCNHDEPQVPNGTNTWTCEVVGDKIVCTTDTPGATPTGGSDWTCSSDNEGGTTCEKELPKPPGGGSYTCGYGDSEFHLSCTGGPPAGPAPPGTGMRICYDAEPGSTGLPTPPEGVWANITAKKAIYNGEAALYIRLTLSKAYVDNTYGDYSIGYSGGPGVIGGGHSFGDLVESDKAEIFIDNPKGDLIFHMVMDYISESPTASSGYACLGVTGGEGSMEMGNASDVMAAQSSLAFNLNGHKYVLLKNSPKTDLNYTPDPQYPKWIFEVWYEAWVKWSAFGSTGPGRVYITGLHASPNKISEGNLTIVPVPCP